MSGALKKTTGLTGLAVSRTPHSELRILYDRILRLASYLPEDYAYKKSVENIVKERNDIVTQTESVAAIEEKIGHGQIEELIVHAKNELSLIQDVIEHRVWEDLIEKAPPHQWTWPVQK